MKQLPAMAAAMLLAGLLAAPAQAQDRVKLVTLGGARLELEMVTRPRDRYRGLSGRDGLAPGRGMAFVYRRPEQRCMLMRGMRFGLDIIWLRDKAVVGVHHRLPPPRTGEEPREACSPQPVDMVIETPAGWAEDQGVGIGSRLD